MTGAASSNPKMASDLEINEVSDGYIVYQPDRDRVHYLNQTATLVLELCNGHNAEADRLLTQAQEMDPEAVAIVLEEHDAARAADARDQPTADQDVERVLPRIPS